MEKAKFGVGSIMLLLSAAVLIMLNVPSATAAIAAVARRCYWCGPLADEVHRSRRSAPCHQGNNYWTVCEPETPYCAIVASSPPFAESRLCVKVNQDECYPQFCNTTKTWKITCPCSEDLCNAYPDDREEMAFSYLKQLVAESQYHNSRIKKSAPMMTSQFISRPRKSLNNDSSAEHSTNESHNAVNKVNTFNDKANKESVVSKTYTDVENETMEQSDSNKQLANEDIKQSPRGLEQGEIKTENIVNTQMPIQDTTREESELTHTPKNQTKEESLSNILLIKNETISTLSTTAASVISQGDMMQDDKAPQGVSNIEKTGNIQQIYTPSTVRPTEMAKRNTATSSNIEFTIIGLILLKYLL